MNDLERDVRSLLDADAAEVRRGDRPPSNLRRRIRRRQAFAIGAAGGAVAMIAAGAIALVTLLPGADGRSTVAGRTTTTGTMNGITITYPQGWSLIDPDAAGLTGRSVGGEINQLPRLVLFVSSAAPDDTLACPGMEGATPRWFVLSVQEQPLAMTGAGAATWPVEPAQQDRLPEAGCYPGWEFLQARWTAAGRTFDGRIGIAPDVADADRAAVFEAFASMTFAASGPPTSAVIATGTAGGEAWELVASKQRDGLELSLNADSFGTGSGGFDPTSDDLFVTEHVFGEGASAERVVFGAVPSNVVQVAFRDGPGEGIYDVVDVPDEIDRAFDAFVVTVPPDASTAIFATDAGGELVATGSFGGGPSEEPPTVQEGPGGLDDGRHFGFIRSVDLEAGALSFDLAIWLSGAEADAAWQAAGNTGSVPNDYFVVNDNARLRTLALSSDLQLRLLDWGHCCDTVFDGDLETFAQAIAAQRDVEVDGVIYRGQSSWWLTVRDGVVTSIEEQYTP